MVFNRATILFALALSFGLPFSQSVFQQEEWKVIEHFRFDWNGDGTPDEFVVQAPADSVDNGDYSRLVIRIYGQPEYVVEDRDGLVRIADNYNTYRKNVKNLASSEFILFLRAEKSRPHLVLFGWPYASSPGSLHVLGLDKKGKPQRIFEQREFELMDVSDLDGDGQLEIVGKPCLTQTWGDGLLTYDPFHVYRLPMAGPAQFSLPLSKSYNLQHYYGWAGPDCSEQLAVVLCPPNGDKPVIMKSEEALKLPARPCPRADRPPKY